MKNPTRPNFLEQDERIRWALGYEGLYAVTDLGKVISYYGDGPTRRKTQNAARISYEQVMLSKDRKKRGHYVHRLVLEAFVGPCPEGMECCHANGDPADNRLENLRWGTPKANALDKSLHGTSAKKLSENDVLEIRRAFAERDAAFPELAIQHGVTDVLIGKIVRGEVWSHVGGPVSEENTRYGEAHQNSKLCERSVRKIRHLYASGATTQRALAGRFGVSVQSINNVVNFKTWAHVD